MNSVPRPLGALLDVFGIEASSLFGEQKRDAGRNREPIVTWLYRILDTLDNKTGHILRFTALLLAAQTFLAAFVVNNQHAQLWIKIAVLSLLFLPLGTGVAALWVFRVSWDFFGHVRTVQSDIGTDDRIEKELRELAEICDKRVRANRRSYFLSCCSVGAFVMTLGFALLVVWKYGH